MITRGFCNLATIGSAHERVRYRHIRRQSKLPDQNTRCGPIDIPRRARWPEYRQIRLPVSVVIAGNGQITRRAERHRVEGRILASQHKPRSVRRPPECNVDFSVAGVVTGNDLVRTCAELKSGHASGASIDPPFAAARTEDRNVSFAVTVIVRRYRRICR